MSAFSPQHDQPVTLSQLNQLEPGLLTDEVSRLQNSIFHLQRSNTELLEFLRPPTTTGGAAGAEEEEEEELDEKTKGEFEKSIAENEVTIARQQERLEMIRLALQNQLGVDAANSHYDVATGAAGTPLRGATGGAVGGEGEVVGVRGRVEGGDSPAPAQVNGTLADDDDGMYL